jgi:hypothetical protein
MIEPSFLSSSLTSQLRSYPQEGLMVKQSLVNKYKRNVRQFLKRWIGRWSNREKNKHSF